MAEELVEFSDEERYVLRHFRASAAGKWRRGAIFELSCLLISLALIAVYLVRGDSGAGAVAYALVFWRAWSAFWRSRRYTKVYRSIFTKYETRLQELGGAVESPPKT